MKSNDESWMAFLDPEFSVLELSPDPRHRDVQYLDVVTGWQASRRTGTAGRDASAIPRAFGERSRRTKE